jgi:hypothetical protein
MQQFFKLASGLSSPAILIVVLWGMVLACVAIGPIDYPMQPTPAVLALVAAGISLFVAAYFAGAGCFRAWFKRRENLAIPSTSTLNNVVVTTSLFGVAGIGLMTLDRLVLSGVGNSGYTELLRCAPGLVDFIEVKRTPLLYVGYLTFSFGFASLAMFLLKGEEIKGWVAILAQLSILSPAGYAILYSGRMPILFVIVLIVSAMLVRIAQGRRPLPNGHHLFLKMAAVLLLFVVYSSGMWASRQNFCVQMSGLIFELQQRMHEPDPEPAAALGPGQAKLKQQQAEFSAQPDPNVKSNEPNADQQKEQAAGVTSTPSDIRQTPAAVPQPPRPDKISASDLSKMIAEKAGQQAPVSVEVRGFQTTMQESWHVRPRPYVVAAIDSGRLSPNAAMSLLSTYFYLTHGIRVMDMVWRERAQFSPHWGFYEIGILSPIFRVFFPQNQQLADMERQLKSTGIYGFFPTVWAAAFIDFGIIGAVIYVAIWGFAAGWSAFGAKHSSFATPPLLLAFILASIFLSPVQGPLGIANSALVLFSIILTGLAIDLPSFGASSVQAARELKLRASG